MADAISPSVFDFSAPDVAGRETSLAEFRGKVLLIVNTASRCGYTPQYAGLEALYEKYKDRGLAVLGFPCNQFGAQEPGTEAEIAQFCSLNYDVTFPIFAKVDVNGAHAHPLFQFLKSEKTGLFGTENIKWNFTKFLIGKDGRILKRFSSKVTPDSPEVVAAIEAALAAK